MFLGPPLSCPGSHSEPQPYHIFPRRLSNSSRYISGSTVGTVGQLQSPSCLNSFMYLSPQSTAAKSRPVSVVGTLHFLFRYPTDAKIYQANCGYLIHGLCSYTERFSFLFFSHTAPGAQLWFCPHFCLWATLRHLFPNQARGKQKWQLIWAHLGQRVYCGHS